jgi:outer membrane protein OmpA-like peptidoglycan-associated protein
MKAKLLISLILFASCALKPQPYANQPKTNFNWNDTLFTPGEKHLINVPFGEHGLIPESEDSLKTFVQFMKKHSNIKVEIGVHTDPRGSAKHNLVLSQAKAQCIADYLIIQGIDSARLVPLGYGFSKPLPGCSAADIEKMQTMQEKEIAWQKDRRTELVILGTYYKK